MLKLNARDLVKRAQQLADLENSDFISWNENMMLLNEAYQKVYQRTIDHDDKTYLKTITLQSGVADQGKVIFDLPDDFYQLYALNHAHTNRCIVRNSINDPVNTTGYTIENNQIIIQGVEGDVVMKYYPIPPTITLKGKDVNINLPSDFNKSFRAVDVFDTKLVYVDTTENSIKIYDMLLEQEIGSIPVDHVNDITILVAGKNGIYYNITNDGYTVYGAYFSTWDNLYFSPVSCALILDKDKNIVTYDNGALYYQDEFGSRFDISAVENVQVQYFLSSESIVIYLIDDTYLAFNDRLSAVSRKKIAFLNYQTNEQTEETYDVCSDGVYYMFREFYLEFNRSLKRNGESVDTAVIGINKIDENTGYGYTSKRGAIKGIFDDTELDYPNNLFIQYLAYQLALQYKSKQNADAPGLISLFNQAEEQFFETIRRDEYGFTRIQNVY